jgi:hypothetical protein
MALKTLPCHLCSSRSSSTIFRLNHFRICEKNGNAMVYCGNKNKNRKRFGVFPFVFPKSKFLSRFSHFSCVNEICKNESTALALSSMAWLLNL